METLLQRRQGKKNRLYKLHRKVFVAACVKVLLLRELLIVTGESLFRGKGGLRSQGFIPAIKETLAQSEIKGVAFKIDNMKSINEV